MNDKTTLLLIIEKAVLMLLKRKDRTPEEEAWLDNVRTLIKLM